MVIKTDPIRRFAQLYDKIVKPDIPETSAVVLATASRDGKPSARVVLLKEFDEQGFVFYTNLESRKAKELQVNPYCALCFYWEQIDYQVRVEGMAVRVSDSEADEYFASRPKDSQISSWASQQSTTLGERQELGARFNKYKKMFESRDVPRPPFWSGYRVLPERVEFWKRRENRLHERTLYIRENASWVLKLLYP
ncbi:MAG: pyridoxamine 5'-phosphate oxidase [bacterium]